VIHLHYLSERKVRRRRNSIFRRTGLAQAPTAQDEEFNNFNLAAAIAVNKASCGWDESASIVVMINKAEVRVWPRFDDQQWIAEDSEEK